jgi:hypothetical protein
MKYAMTDITKVKKLYREASRGTCGRLSDLAPAKRIP